ncbi:MAG: carbohydrate ABC transporter permease [Eisenbergiella sp.]
MKKTGKILVRAVWLVFMSAVALIMLFPLIYSVLGGFNTKTEFTSLSRILPIPTKWVMSNYIFAFSTSAIKPLINTFMRTAWYTVIVLVMSTLVGYVMARYEFRFKKTFFAIIIAAQVIPSVLTLIPTFVMVSNIPLVGGNNILGQGGQGLYNNQLMLYLPLSWGYLLWVFLFMQVHEIASHCLLRRRGAGWLRLFQNLSPGGGSHAEAYIDGNSGNVSLNTWNDWMTPFLYINSTQKSTLPAYLATLTAQLQNFGEKDYPKLFALATVAIIPPGMIFLFLQKYIVQGIASAGVKE